MKSHVGSQTIASSAVEITPRGVDGMSYDPGKNFINIFITRRADKTFTEARERRRTREDRTRVGGGEEERKTKIKFKINLIIGKKDSVGTARQRRFFRERKAF